MLIKTLKAQPQKMIGEKNQVEVKIWIRDADVNKVFIKSGFKALPGIFVVMFAYFLYSFGFLPIAISKGDIRIVFLVCFLVAVMASAISVLYAVGSGFQAVSELEKTSQKTRVIFSQSKIEFIKGFDSIEKKWTYFRRIKETVDGFRVYPNDEKGFFINHYAFRTRADIFNFREIVRTQINNKANLRND